MHKVEVMNTTSILYFLFIIIINLSVSPPINGDTTLVSNVCNTTPYPKDCHSCLDNNTGAPQMTVRELAAEVMYCTYNMSKALNQRFTDLVSKGAEYTICATKLYDYGDKLIGAMTWWYQWGDGVAKKEFDAAKDDYSKCEKALRKLTSPLPSDVKGLLKGMNNLYQDCANIMLQSKA